MNTGSLDIIITHYREPWNVGKPLFDSIAMQRMVNLENVGVILVNDGEENELPKECFDGYPFEINQISIPHGGVSKARNTGLDHSQADWVMFCDFDDRFANIFGLYLIFCGIEEDKYDTIWSCFAEETKDADGKMILVQHQRDWVFIHGKAHRRQYLIDKDIRFNEKLTIHEDAFFTMLTQSCTEPERVGAIKTPFYLWTWNDNSVVRRDGAADYILLTYDQVMRQRIALTEEFLKRGMNENAMTVIIKTVLDSYYDFQQVTWLLPQNADLVKKAENWFAAYLKRYANYYTKADVKTIAAMMKVCREHAMSKGAFFIEQQTIHDWMVHIIEKAKPVPKWEQNV